MANCSGRCEDNLNEFSSIDESIKTKEEILLDESDDYDIVQGIRRLRMVPTGKSSKSLQNNSSKEDSEKIEKVLDVFISYRRSNGAELASLLDFILKSKNLKVFLDVKTLKAGKFDDNLLRSIKQSRNFILVLTPKALDRCVGDEECKDWVHKEVVAALQFDCNIIPITDEKFTWPEAEDLPQDMRPICSYNGIRWVHEYQDAVIEELLTFVKKKTDVNEHSKQHQQELNYIMHRILMNRFCKD